ncbi:MAG: 30S ribosomal protein S16 [Cytophagaceae bacterium]|nr:30S ribosomal protein S16 [Cytophagaceae bacterium]
MSVKIRLARRGRRNSPIFDIVVADSRSPRDGKFIEKLGSYNPLVEPAGVELNDDKAFQWIMNGALPSDTVRTLLSKRGLMFKKHLQIGVLKGAITQEKADKQFEDWKSKKQAALVSKLGELSKKQSDAKKAKLAAEAKVNEARIEAIKAKNVVKETPAPEATAPAENTEAPAAEEPKAE